MILVKEVGDSLQSLPEHGQGELVKIVVFVLVACHAPHLMKEVNQELFTGLALLIRVTCHWPCLPRRMDSLGKHACSRLEHILTKRHLSIHLVNEGVMSQRRGTISSDCLVIFAVQPSAHLFFVAVMQT